VREVVKHPKHPYSVGLMASIPPLDRRVERLAQIEGSMPRLSAIPPGCPFNPRCPHAFARCLTERPELLETGATRAACWLYDAASEKHVPGAPPHAADGTRVAQHG
jgi:peptide/nickel transport system ATP-binding protein